MKKNPLIILCLLVSMTLSCNAVNSGRTTPEFIESAELQVPQNTLQPVQQQRLFVHEQQIQQQPIQQPIAQRPIAPQMQLNAAVLLMLAHNAFNVGTNQQRA